MKLPGDYLRLVTDGTRALRAVGEAVRALAVHHPETPELWLSVRNIEGLANRLASLIDHEWRSGTGTLLITGQDVGVLEDLLVGRDPALRPPDDEHLTALERLHDFLRQYCDLEFEREQYDGFS